MRGDAGEVCGGDAGSGTIVFGDVGGVDGNGEGSVGCDGEVKGLGWVGPLRSGGSGRGGGGTTGGKRGTRDGFGGGTRTGICGDGGRVGAGIATGHEISYGPASHGLNQRSYASDGSHGKPVAKSPSVFLTWIETVSSIKVHPNGRIPRNGEVDTPWLEPTASRDRVVVDKSPSPQRKLSDALTSVPSEGDGT